MTQERLILCSQIVEQYKKLKDKETIKNTVESKFNRLLALKAWGIARGEFVITLNRTLRDVYEAWDMELSELWQRLREKYHDWCCDNLKGDELSDYLRTVD